MRRFFKSFLLMCFLVMQGEWLWAAPAANSSGAEDLSAKAFLEDLMVRRYSQGLGTIVDRQAFSLGVQLDLITVVKPPPKVDPQAPIIDTPVDLLVGTLDPEKLLQQSGLSNVKEEVVGMLATKRIKFVQVNVGLREDLGPKVKEDVEKWMSTRLNREFGKIAKSEVTFVKEIPPKPKSPEISEPKQWWDWLNQFQHLVGEVFLAMALLMGIMLWRFTTSKSSVARSNAGESPSIKLEGSAGGPAQQEKDKPSEQQEADLAMRIRAQEEVFTWSQKLGALAPKISSDFENIVRSWCQAGDEGKLKLACFAEAVGRDIGRLPIPVDAMKDVGKVFAKMAEVSPQEKAQVLEKVYWDLMSVMNLGAEVLSQPFGYLAGLDTGLISQVLMDQNPKMKTLVSLYLPEDVRRNFVKPMTAEEKLALLENASQMSEIGFDELRSIDKSIMGKLKSGDSGGNTVQLDMTLEKVISSLNIIEEIEMLGKLAGSGIIAYKRKYPSLAFIKEWPDEKLSILMGRVSSDAIATYLRFEPDMQNRLVSLAPPLLAEVLSEEMAQPDKTSQEEKIRNLESLASLLREMVSHKEVDLTEIFPSIALVKNDERDGVKIA